MCGIAGFIDFTGTSNESTIRSMIQPLHHRGPDGEGTMLLKNDATSIGFGHKRLSIIDLSSSGHQPMAYSGLYVTFNGEIYNYAEIKATLVQLGHSFESDSDTEVILHAFKEWGEDCVHRFIGMFAIFIYDEAKQKVTAFRDRAGVKPLFYYWHNNLFLFASELKAFHEHPAFEKELDISAVAAFTQYGSVPTPHCIFKNCAKLKPGHILTIDLATKSVNTSQYWNVYDAFNKPKLNLSYQDAKEELSSLMTSAFQYRMVSDVPVGIFLSGGYDSTAVTSILQKEASSNLRTFTIGVPDIGLNEAPYAKDIAEHLGTDHTELICSEKEAIEMIKDLPFNYDEPFADSSAIPTTLVSKLARKDVTVALSADGGDELFAGYNRYDYITRYSKKLNKMPKVSRSALVGLMNRVPSQRIPYFKNKYNFHNRYEKLKGVLKNPSDKEIMLSLSQQFTDDQMKEIVRPSFSPLETMYLSDELQDDFKTPLSFMLTVDFQTYLLDDILQKVDRATMTHALEGREPMLDHRLVEFAAQLPDAYKYQDGVKKRILRDIVHDHIPKNLLDRPKMGFAIPIGKWLNNELKDYVEEYLSESRIVEQGIFNWNYVKKLKQDFFNGRAEYDSKIWYFLMFQMWHARWMEN